MEFKADALLLRAVDYGENDRMVTLLTAEHGKLGAVMKGVRKAGAKLNFASQPFCFAEYILSEKSGRYTVTSAFLHEGFYDLRTDLEKYYGAASVLEMCNVFAYEGMPSGELLVAAVKALKGIETANGAPMSELVAFLLDTVTLAGYPVTAADCPFCGGKIAGRRYFDLASGSFGCNDCARGVPASEVTYATIRRHLTSAPEGDEGSDGALRAIRLLKAYITYQTDATLPALDEFLTIVG